MTPDQLAFFRLGIRLVELAKIERKGVAKPVDALVVIARGERTPARLRPNAE
jgi:hypothetical protein